MEPADSPLLLQVAQDIDRDKPIGIFENVNRKIPGVGDFKARGLRLPRPEVVDPILGPD
jgi:hypothetical protein